MISPPESKYMNCKRYSIILLGRIFLVNYLLETTYYLKELTQSCLEGNG